MVKKCFFLVYCSYCSKNPKNGQKWVLNKKKRSDFFWLKSKMANTQKLKLDIQKV